ncbi:MAG: hypothetical protein GF347_03730 [Candidatus Moranbacteria bacterium]|nr:hypothetical protein [Candidatus Moranbacteria bacterium]
MEIFYIIVIILGAAAGSFVNVLVYRIEKNRSFTLSRSICPACKKRIKWYDNVPVLSFFYLKGRCRYCKRKISVQYPLVESLTALIFLIVIYFKAPLEVRNLEWLFLDRALLVRIFFFLLYYMAVISILMGVFIIDLKHYIIPNRLVYPGIIIVLLNNLLVSLFDQTLWLDFFNSAFYLGILGALISGGFFFLQVYISKEKWMGWGDVKFGVFMGLLLGFPNILAGLFLAYVLGAFVGLILLNLKSKKINSEIPFGPFLCMGTLIALLFADSLISLYFPFF